MSGIQLMGAPAEVVFTVTVTRADGTQQTGTFVGVTTVETAEEASIKQREDMEDGNQSQHSST